MNAKKCTKCGEAKSTYQFGIDMSNNYKDECLECRPDPVVEAQRTSENTGASPPKVERGLQRFSDHEISFPGLMMMAQGHKNFGRDVFNAEVDHE